MGKQRVWNDEETKQLIDLFEEDGKKWKSHAQMLGRTPSSLRNKYQRIVRAEHVAGVKRGVLRAGPRCGISKDAIARVDFDDALPADEPMLDPDVEYGEVLRLIATWNDGA